jgi:hypothetical protein
MNISGLRDPFPVRVCQVAAEVLPNQGVWSGHRAILRRHCALKVLDPGLHKLLVWVLLPVVFLPTSTFPGAV